MTLHIMALGQSSLANHGLGRAVSPHGKVLHDGRMYPMSDPILGGSGDMGSIWPRFADCFQHHRKNADLIISLRAMASTSIADWSLNGKCYASLAARLDVIRSSAIAPTHVVFHQGERDNLLGTSTQTYIERFVHLHKLVSAALPDAAWIICQASWRAGVTADAITEAQRAIATSLRNCRPGPNTDELGNEHRYDGTHFDSIGLEAFARQLVACF